MEKNIKINVPDGYTVQWNADSSEVTIVKKIDPTYKEMCSNLFTNKAPFYTNDNGNILRMVVNPCSSWIANKNNGVTELQLQKMLAYNKLMNIAAYLNEGWEPNWNDSSEKKCFITYNYKDSAYETSYNRECRNGVPVFKTEDLARRAIDSMGADLDILYKK